VCCSKDGSLALSGSKNRLFLWDLHKGSALRAVRTFVGHTDVISQCAFTSNSEYALSCSSDGTVRLWDVNRGTQIRQYDGHIGIVNDVIVSADDQYVFSAGADKMIMIWELSSGRLVRKFEAHKDGVFSICLSLSNRYLISGGADNTIFVWELDWDWAFPPG
jgi:WD40 repeat protein